MKKMAIFGAGADSTTSYRPGARFAPAEIRKEFYGIETFSPYLDRDLEDVEWDDDGDLELPFGNVVRQLEMIEAKVASIFDSGRLPFMLGGEHLVTLGAVRAAVRRYPDLRIIHFDAHADLREEYLGETLSHATVLRRCHDLVGDGRIFQFGIRSCTKDEHAFIKAGHVATEFFACGTLATLSLPEGASVYLTVDLDALDPSEFPGTGTPEAGGLRFDELRRAVCEILGRFNVVALDNVELAPNLDASGRSTALCCKLIREEILAR